MTPNRRISRLPLLLAMAATLASCSREEPAVPITLGAGPERSSTAESREKEFRFGIGAMISPGTTIELYGRLVEEVGRRLGKRGVAVQRGSYAEINDLLEQRRIDAALVCTGAYLAGRRKFGMELLLVPQFEGRLTYHSVVLVRKDSGLARFEDLKGRKFAFVDPLSNTGRFYPVSRVLDLGENPRNFFKTQYTHGHDRSIRAVREGIVDGAAVDELIYRYIRRKAPEEVRGLTILERSPPYGAPPIVVHPLTTSEDRSRIRAAFLALTEGEMGRGILSDLGIEEFAAPPPGLYESAAELEQRIRRYDEERSGR